MKVKCKECGHEFDDFNYLKGKEKSMLCDDCRHYLELAMNEDDYSIFTNYLKAKEQQKPSGSIKKSNAFN